MGMRLRLLSMGPESLEDAIREVSSDDSSDSDVYDALVQDGLATELDIDKAWDGLNFGLVRQQFARADEPLGHAVAGATPIGPDVGFGPARFNASEQVKAIHAALEKLDDEAFKRNLENSTGVALYAFALGQNSDGEVEELCGELHRLREFYSEATQRDRVVLSVLS